MTEPGQPKRFGDIRDDYDDDFTKVVTPRDRARRRLMIPAIGIIFTGVLGIGGMIAAAIGLAVEFFAQPFYTEEAILFSFFLALVATGGYLFFFVVWGGISLIRLRRYRMALFAAFFVTALSVGGFYSLLFFPFGVSALILLYGSNARKEFEGYVAPATASPVKVEGAMRTSAFGDVRDDFDDEFGQTVPPDVAIRRKVRIPAYGMMTAGVLGVLAMLLVFVATMIDFATSNKYRDEGDVVAVLCLTSPGTAFAAIMFFGGWCLLKQKRYVWAVVGAFFVTSLALGGVMGVLFYPFGIWALILLYRDDVRKAFGLSTARQPRAAGKNAIPAREMVSKVAGAMGLCVIVVGVVLTLDDFFAGELTGEEAVIATTVLGLGTIGFAGLFAYSFYLSRKRRAEPVPSASVSQRTELE